MQRSLPGAFQTVGNALPIVVGDNWNSTQFSPARTVGAYIIAPTPTLDAPTPFSRWQILSFSMTARLILVLPGPAPYYGKFGKIICGLTKHAPISNTGQDYPEDPTLAGRLWDPAQDPLPPIYTEPLPTTPAVPLYLPLRCNVQFPQPIEVTAGTDPPNIGIWIEPSLLGAGPPAISGTGQSPLILVLSASYTITYNDGN